MKDQSNLNTDQFVYLLEFTTIISKHPGEDIYTWGWGGANGTFFEEGHSSVGKLVSCLLPLQQFIST